MSNGREQIIHGSEFVRHRNVRHHLIEDRGSAAEEPAGRQLPAKSNRQ
jgi:hypothetical protein